MYIHLIYDFSDSAGNNNLKNEKSLLIQYEITKTRLIENINSIKYLAHLFFFSTYIGF